MCMCVCLCMCYLGCFMQQLLWQQGGKSAVVVLHHRQETKSVDLCSTIGQHYLFITFACPKSKKQVCVCLHVRLCVCVRERVGVIKITTQQTASAGTRSARWGKINWVKYKDSQFQHQFLKVCWLTPYFWHSSHWFVTKYRARQFIFVFLCNFFFQTVLPRKFITGVCLPF